jgi:DnaJ-class molecular chaperone
MSKLRDEAERMVRLVNSLPIGMQRAASHRQADYSECPECYGNGFHPDAPDRACRLCFGTGRVRNAR